LGKIDFNKIRENMDKESELKNLFDDTQNIRFGCVMFDLQEAPGGKMIPVMGSGWASIDGKTSFRIRSSGELSNNVKWLTNLSQDVFWKSGAVKQTKLKHSGYLRTDITQIMKELGLNPPKMPVAQICETLSELFARVMKLAIEFYGIDSFNQKDLHAEIKEKLIKSDQSISVYVDEALSRAYQDLVICEQPLGLERYIHVTLKRPRYFHAKSIFDTAIPLWNQDWTFYSQNELPKTTEEKIKFLMDQEKPFIAKISINAFHQPENLNIDLSKLLNLGEAIGEGGKTKERNWVCQPELLYLSKFTDLNIDAAFIADGYQIIDVDKFLPYLGDLSDFSYSLGLLAECAWIGLASRSVNQKTKSKSLVSPRACWLKSADRFMTLTSAMMMSSAGFIVNSYGYGGVSIMVDEKDLAKLIEMAPHAGLSVPLNIIEKKPFIF
jgi:hypothetical protein